MYCEELKENTAYELVQLIQDAVLESKDKFVPVVVEDEECRIEHIGCVWYDDARKMIRISVDNVYFQDVESE